MSNDPHDMMLELFRSEVESHSDMLTSSLLALEQEASPSTLERMMRAAHSIKGAARIVQVAPAVDVAHAMEDCFVAAQKGNLVITPDDVDVLLKGVDLLGQIAAASRDPGTNWNRFQGDVQGLVVELKGVLSGERSAPPPALPKTSVTVSPPAAAGPAISTSPSPAPREPARLVVTARFLDAAAAEPLRQQLLSHMAQGMPRIELDLQPVEDLDAVGLTFLASAQDYAARRGTDLRYLRVSPGVATVLRLTGVTTVGGESSR